MKRCLVDFSSSNLYERPDKSSSGIQHLSTSFVPGLLMFKVNKTKIGDKNRL